MKLTKARMQVFLRHLAEHGVARDAARAASPDAAGVDGAYSTFRDERTRSSEFAQQWTDAVGDAIAKMEREAFRRGVEGWVERGVFDKDGNRVGEVVRYSDRLLELSLKRHIPEYREKSQVDVKAQATTTNLNVSVDPKALQNLSDEDLTQLEALLARATART